MCRGLDRGGESIDDRQISNQFYTSRDLDEMVLNIETVEVVQPTLERRNVSHTEEREERDSL